MIIAALFIAAGGSGVWAFLARAPLTTMGKAMIASAYCVWVAPILAFIGMSIERHSKATVAVLALFAIMAFGGFLGSLVGKITHADRFGAAITGAVFSLVAGALPVTLLLLK